MFEHFDLRVFLVEHINGLEGFQVVKLGAEVPPGLIGTDRGVSVDYGATEYQYSYPATLQAPANSGCVIMLRADTPGPDGFADLYGAVAGARELALSIHKINAGRDSPGFTYMVVSSTETGYVQGSSDSQAELHHVIRVEARKLSGV